MNISSIFNTIRSALCGKVSAKSANLPSAQSHAPVLTPHAYPSSSGACLVPAKSSVSSAIDLKSVFDPNGNAVTLGQAIGRGGEATVYRIAEKTDVLVKLYHSKALQQPAKMQLLQRKIAVLSGMGKLRESPLFAWPKFPVFNARREWVGFAMRQVSGVPLTLLTSSASMQRDLSHWDLRHVVSTVGRIAMLLNTLAKQGVLAGDISASNFLVDKKSAQVSCIDCDSYQVSDSFGLLASPVLTPTHAAPELLEAGRADAPRTLAMLNFSSAVLFFQILTQGVHPFQHHNCEDPATNIRRGRCAIGQDTRTFLQPVLWERYNKLPRYIKGLFIRTFRDGHSSPDKRPSLSEWVGAFKEYLQQLQQPAGY